MQLQDKISLLPNKPGCYLFKNGSGKVLYIGKAKALKKRVSSYLRDNLTVKTQYLMSRVSDFDFMITKTEAESLILENNLIKKYKPKYNIRLRDDKSYPYIAVSELDSFPRLIFLRRPRKKKGLRLFGPYPHGSSIGHIIRILNKLFKLRDCSDFEFKSRKTPCLLYQIDQCSAPCVSHVSKKEYAEDVHNVLKFLEGRKTAQKVLNELEEKMSLAAQEENFEHAAILRDGLFELQKFINGDHQQSVEQVGLSKDVDIISYYKGELEVDLSFYMMRGGILIGQKSFYFLREDFLEDIETEMTSLIFEHYQKEINLLPDNLVVDIIKDKRDLLKVSFQMIGEEQEIKFISPASKHYQKLVESTREHAKQTQVIRAEAQVSEFRALSQLSRLLGLKERAYSLECYDIAIWQGKSPTASLIYFEEGKPVKSRYRYYHLEERPEGNNDFAMMEEVFSRRIKRELFPDVFVVDGGKGQVSSAKKILNEAGIDIPVVGIAKSKTLSNVIRYQKEIDHSEERLVIHGRKDAINLRKYPELYRLLTTMRDEAHRFSRKLHHKAEKSRVFKSWVDEVKGLNNDDRKLLLSHYQTVVAVSQATFEELEQKLELKKGKINKIINFALDKNK